MCPLNGRGSNSFMRFYSKKKKIFPCFFSKFNMMFFLLFDFNLKRQNYIMTQFDTKQYIMTQYILI